MLILAGGFFFVEVVDDEVSTGRGNGRRAGLTGLLERVVTLLLVLVLVLVPDVPP